MVTTRRLRKAALLHYYPLRWKLVYAHFVWLRQVLDKQFLIHIQYFNIKVMSLDS